ncbi:hypothetical protein [Raoultella planticola]|uniref:hypothetical protein n=1 Tax=Raoultella planticola TaxID=575 RepID=UPI001C9E013D|nr:hypothetical protein [Raoultella planticola]QZS66416.1 hypothetical protein K6028_11580 [Raoultella planticola]
MRFNKRNELHRVRTRQWSWNWYAGGDEEPLHRGHLIERDSQLNGENHPKNSAIGHASPVGKPARQSTYYPPQCSFSADIRRGASGTLMVLIPPTVRHPAYP